MVVGRTRLPEERADRVFRALADPTRRDVLRRSMQGTLSVSGLARLYPMSTTAVQKHVAVLEGAGLVHLTRHGREQLVKTEIDTIVKAQSLLAEFELLWRGRIDRIGDVLANPSGGDRP
jgi:DNA-binding transcriptional ArsR family regulator